MTKNKETPGISMQDIHFAINETLGNVSNVSVSVFDPSFTRSVRVTRRRYGDKKKFMGELSVRIGKLNYSEKEYLKKCKTKKVSPNRLWVGKKSK